MIKYFFNFPMLILLTSCGADITFDNTTKQKKGFITINDMNDTLEIDNTKFQSIIKKIPKLSIAQIKSNTKEKTVYIVWASWCSYCKPYLQDLDSLKKANPDFKFCTLNGDKMANIDKALIELNQFKIYTDSYQMDLDFSITDLTGQDAIMEYLTTIGTDFKSSPGLPFTFVIDSSNHITSQFVGYNDSIKKNYKLLIN